MLGDEYHAGVQQLVRDMNAFYRASPALWALDASPDGFSWIDANDAAGNTLSYLRFAAPAPSEAPAPPPVPSWLVAEKAGSAGPVPGPALAAPEAGPVVAVPEAGPAVAVPEATAPAGPIGFPPTAQGAKTVAVVANFSGGPYEKYMLGLPHAGRWVEVLNTDAAIYGGSGVGNLGAVQAVEEKWHGRPASATITVPPLGVLWLAPET